MDFSKSENEIIEEKNKPFTEVKRILKKDLSLDKAYDEFDLIILIHPDRFGLLLLLFIFQRNLLYQPSSSGSLSPAAYGLPGMTRVKIQTQDGLVLEAWYREARDSKQTILYLHGNAGHLGHRAGKIKHYLDAGYGILLLSYRGYGPNPGKPTSQRMIQPKSGHCRRFRAMLPM